jgi:hypothetical protein
MHISEPTLERQFAHSRRGELKPMQDLLSYLREYARQRPEAIALACFGLGFMLGWKLKPW